MDFITGATGIVGRELVSQLISAGHTVKALYRNNSDVTSVENLITSRCLSFKMVNQEPSLMILQSNLNFYQV